MAKSGEKLEVGHLAGILLVSMAALLLELCLTRLLAVTLWYHFAFMIISTALLGFGAAAVAVSVVRRLREAALGKALPAASALFAFAIVGSFALSQAVPLEPFSMAENRIQILYLVVVYLLLTLPFFLAGIVVALLLARLTRSATLLYAFDLVGAGLGAVLGLALLGSVGAPSALVLAGAAAALGAAAFAWPRGWKARASGLLLAALLGLLSASADDWLPLRISRDKMIGGGTTAAEALADDDALEATAWSATGRVDVLRSEDGWRRMVIDGGVAATRVPPIRRGELASFEVPEEGMRAALALVDRPRVLVIGSGGGTEVAAALAAGASHVTAVEMNDAIVRLVREDLAEVHGGLFDDPRVDLVTDEGRSYVRRAGAESFDLIVCAHTISNAAVASGALSLTENYTLTVEALEDFFRALRPGGVLWITRPEAQLPRLVATARAALAARGDGAPAEHLIAYRRPSRTRSFLGGLIAGVEPLDDGQVAAALRALHQDRLEPLALPRRPATGPFAAAYDAARDGDAPAFDPALGVLEPCTDDRPYFNQRLPWSRIGLAELRAVLGQGRNSRMALEEAPVAEVAVLVVLVWACLLSLLFVIAPLALHRRGKTPIRGSARVLPYFVALGLGYITVEICLIQRLGLFVGRPEYAMAVVLGAMLVSSGAGSLVATHLGKRPRRGAALAALGVSALVLLDAVAAPAAVEALLGLSLGGRLAAAALLTAPLGFAMGMPMPLGLEAAAPDSPALASWAFGLNCATSVVGSVLSVILSSSVGFNATLVAAGAVYGLAALATRAWPPPETEGAARG